jgi:hypothetical protein
MSLTIINNTARPIIIPIEQDIFTLLPGVNLGVPESLVSYAKNHETIVSMSEVGMLSFVQASDKQTKVVDKIDEVPVNAVDGVDGAQPVTEVKKKSVPASKVTV